MARKIRVDEPTTLRGQFATYILPDVLKTSYIVACLLIDGLVIPELYQYKPAGMPYSQMLGLNSAGIAGFDVYLAAVVVLIEIGVLLLQVAIYRRYWPKRVANSEAGTF